MTTVKNGKSRFNFDHSSTCGPRGCLILSLLLKHRTNAKQGASVTMTATQIGTSFGFDVPSSISASLRTLRRRGLVVRYTRNGKVCSDGAINGATYGLSSKGTALAHRLSEVSGLGRTLAVVSGYRIETPISE